MRRSSRVATLLAVAALPLALAACSSGSSGGSGSGAGAAPVKAKDLNAGLATGTQLKKALAPASAFPAGLALEADSASDSGGMFLSPSGKSTGKPDCTRLEGTSWI
ncbi:hypothetical protein ACFC0P_30355, partial [Streptomyces broussonetiae]